MALQWDCAWGGCGRLPYYFIENQDCDGGFQTDPRYFASECCECRARTAWIDGSSLSYSNFDAYSPYNVDPLVLVWNSKQFVWKNPAASSNFYVCKRNIGDAIYPLQTEG